MSDSGFKIVVENGGGTNLGVSLDERCEVAEQVVVSLQEIKLRVPVLAREETCTALRVQGWGCRVWGLGIRGSEGVEATQGYK